MAIAFFIAPISTQNAIFLDSNEILGVGIVISLGPCNFISNRQMDLQTLLKYITTNEQRSCYKLRKRQV